MTSDNDTTTNDSQPTDAKPAANSRLRFGWATSKLKAVDDKAGSLTKTISDNYGPKELLGKFKPYVHKAVLGVAIAAANEALNDEEKMEAIYSRLIKFLPDSVSRYIPEKILFKYMWSMKDGLLKQVDDLKTKIESSNDTQAEITRLTEEADHSVQEFVALEGPRTGRQIVPTTE